jgi:hypothetical protein
MFFKKGDILVVKGSVTPNRAYDGVFVSEDTLDIINFGFNVVDDTVNLDRNERDTQYVTLKDLKDVRLPSSIFNKAGEMYDDVQKNDTHYFRSKKTYNSLADYVLDI